MTDALSEEALIAAFQDALPPMEGAEEPVDMDLLMAALAGELDADATAAVIDRTITDPHWAAGWQRAKQLRAVHDEPPPLSVVRRTAPWIAVGVALAAAVLLWIGARPVQPVAMRTNDVHTLQTTVTQITAAEPLLTWTGVQPDDFVRLVVLDDTLQVVHEMEGRGRTEATLPASLLVAGRTLLWRVDLRRPDGSLHTGRTFTLEVR